MTKIEQAITIMFKDYPGKLFAARKDSPLIIGQKNSGCLIASDVPAIIEYTKKAIYLDEIWRLIGVTSNKEVASFIYKIFKTHVFFSERIFIIKTVISSALT